jgi:hypothetical protein
MVARIVWGMIAGVLRTHGGVCRTDTDEQLSFIESVVRKIMRGTHAALARYIKERGLEYSKERSEAVHYLLWWGDGEA